MSVRAQMIDRLTRVFEPTHLDVADESDQHRGHGGWREGGETHFRVTMVSPRFAGASRVDRHRMVNQALAEALNGPVHALALHLKAPGE